MSSIPSSVSSATNHSYEDTSIIEGLVLPLADHCFHCGDPVPQPPFHAEILGQSREMCCMGCQLAAQSIVEAGLEQYYLDRSEINRTASLPTQLTRLEVYDHDEINSVNRTVSHEAPHKGHGRTHYVLYIISRPIIILITMVIMVLQ